MGIFLSKITILHTKIIPPKRSERTLTRQRVTNTLAESLQYRLTILQAGAGYGKSTALALLAEQVQPLVWYQVTEEDKDPLVFLLHLCHATRRAVPELQGLPVAFLESWDGTRGPLPSLDVIDQYLNAVTDHLPAPLLFVLDDIHLVIHSNEIAFLLDRLIGLAPFHLHILLAGRPVINLPSLSRWRAQGDVLNLDQTVLAFNASEISHLFSKSYGYELTTEEAEALLENTEGWAIALQMVWQNIRSVSPASIQDYFDRRVPSLKALFEILAEEVFTRQPEDVQNFLLISATLREMTSTACDSIFAGLKDTGVSQALLPVGGSSAMLAYLRRQDLFTVERADGSLRYHHIFHQFLKQRASAEQRMRWNQAAAGHFLSQGDLDSGIYHLLQAQEYDAAAALLDTYGTMLLNKGRLDSLADCLDTLPPQTLHKHPALISQLGDLARLHSRFQEALGWYQQAERIWRERGQQEGAARALRGQARVYLDTVNPSRAEELLQQSLRLSDGMESRESQARLYELLAENRLNAGKVQEAERLRLQAEALRQEGPSDSQLFFRVLLRTGRLQEARQALEAQAENENLNPVQTPRMHRETLLVLSLIYAFQGETDASLQAAIAGTQRGVTLESPFVTAVGHARQGHALSVLGGAENYQKAIDQINQTVQISRELLVPRLLVESYWGLCRAYGYQGDLVTAERFASEGIEIAIQAGDEWIASLIRTTMGASLVLADRYEAAEKWLEHAIIGFRECSDPFGRCGARLWLSLALFEQKEFEALEGVLTDLLKACREREYDFLLMRPTLVGPPDERILVPLLIHARNNGWEAAYANRLLVQLGLPEIEMHPGYMLRVRTLGGFQTWRGAQEILANGWRREKARQIFQLLLTFRNAPLDRDQIIEYLWPEQDPASAQRNFKVALNALYGVLEPQREPGSESAYIIREGSIYSLRPGADLWLDAELFQTAVQEADRCSSDDQEKAIGKLEFTLELYRGEYLPEARYETWAAAERENLAVRFLRSADRLADLYLQKGDYGNTIRVCQRILAQDACWERAYRRQMIAFHKLGERGQVVRTYQRCLNVLHEELDVPPSLETKNLYRQLVSVSEEV